MKNRRLLWAVAVSSCVIVICSCISRGYSDSVEIRASTRLEKLRMADSVVNDEYLHHLRDKLKVLLPDVRDDDLRNLRLDRLVQELPQSMPTDQSETVRIIVSVHIAGNRDPKPIIKAAIGLVKADLDRVRLVPE